MRRNRLSTRTLTIAAAFVAADAALIASLRAGGASPLATLPALLALDLLAWGALLGYKKVRDSGGILRLVWSDLFDYRIDLRPRRISTRTLMIVAAVVGVDAAMVVQAAKTSLAFTLFIAAVMGTLNLFFATYLEGANRINTAPPEKQTEMILTLGCLLMVIMALLIPVTILVMVRASG